MNRGLGNLGSGTPTFWPTRTERLPGIGTNDYGTFERYLPQQNRKIISGPDAGAHQFYDPRTGRSGEAGPNAPRLGR
jgi:hypothetical protein